MNINFGREICGEPNTVQTREWLVTNGIGGYGSGTVAGMLTRSYHGLLIAALKPPLDRVLLVTKLDETVEYYGQTYPLFTNSWQGGIVDPSGYDSIESFELEGTIPLWHFTFSDALLEKRIWMEPKANTTYIYYTVKRASGLVNLSLKALVNYRSYHGGVLPQLKETKLVNQGVRVLMDVEDTQPFYLFADRGNVTTFNEIYSNFQLPIEKHRGLNDIDNNLHVTTFNISLKVGESLTFVATTENYKPLENAILDPNDTKALKVFLDGSTALKNRRNYEQNLLITWQKNNSKIAQNAPNWIKQLVLAADQFIVDRPLDDLSLGKSVIAGYHWFEDWGRDTMISLPGLALVTGHLDIAKKILSTFAKYISQGMLPNRFPSTNKLTDEDYNTVDATLWYFEAIRLYHAQSKDNDFIQTIFYELKGIIDEHKRGTRYNIKLEDDGLISAGSKSSDSRQVQLTWMDALVKGEVITPRRGKPIEINALWYNALITLSNFAKIIGESSSEYEEMAAKTKKGFERFWNPDKGYCFDVIDVFNTPGINDGENDDSLRPNQLFAISLPESLLTLEQQQSVVSACQRSLLTSNGLRSLDPENTQYKGTYGGDQYHRDIAYHQGTVWGWLISPFALAHLRAYNDPTAALAFLEPIAYSLRSTGLGSINEIFDGNSPYRPRGCIAQAWSVAEVLRAWTEINKRLT
jgi:predicted glycogen debranching enzyme